MKQITKFKKTFLDKVIRSRTNMDINEILDLYSISDTKFCLMYYNRVLPIYIAMMNTFLEQKKTEDFSEFSWNISVNTSPSGISLSFLEDSITISHKVSKNEKLNIKNSSKNLVSICILEYLSLPYKRREFKHLKRKLFFLSFVA